MKELNKHLLTDAINKLPQYQPKDHLWEEIEMALTIEKKEANLKQGIGQLPNYDPPAGVWENIQAGLDEDQKPVARVFNLSRWAAAAAVFVAVSIGSWMFYNASSNGEYVAISYSQEQASPSFLNVNWEEDEDAFAMVAEICKTQHVVCRQPDFKIMTDELDELNSAREELKTAMDAYGNDPDLIAQLTVIENERTDLLKKIIKRI